MRGVLRKALLLACSIVALFCLLTTIPFTQESEKLKFLKDSDERNLIYNRIADGRAGSRVRGHGLQQNITNKMPIYFKRPKNREQIEIVEAFLHAWSNYRSFAWGRDELKPLSKGWIDWLGIGLTIVDSLDTMWIMGLTDEFRIARDWVANNLTFKRPASIQLFEVVIRGLGGLLSAYHLSGDRVFLEKALELGNALLPCFSSKSQIPCTRINLANGHAEFTSISTAEVGTIQLELRDLSRSIQNETFEKFALDISLYLHSVDKLDGLVATFVGSNGRFMPGSTISVGGSADSYYEYLLKQWIQTGKRYKWFREDYTSGVEGIQKHLLRYTAKSRMAFVGYYDSLQWKHFHAEMEHLACFLPGTLALGVMHGLDPIHLELAANLTATCYEMYRQMLTGLGPETAHFDVKPDGTEDILSVANQQQNRLRPETVESIYYMFRATNNPKYRDWGWEIFQAFEKRSKVKNGYACVENVNSSDVTHADRMESFFLAETLKYLYLLFSDSNTVSLLDRFVLNTEAHPLPIYTS